MEKVSNLSYSEIVGFYHLQMGRVEMTWFRIIYLHAAIFGILVFFFEAQTFLVTQRALVLGFYTVNMIVFYVALQEGYEGLKCAVTDLSKFPETDGEVDQWFRSRRLDFKAPVRRAVMIVAWTIVAYLLFWTVIWP
ncbi:MAG: hypothetical protein AAGF53_11225 [Pseudomonadota bacterium]